MSMLGDRKLIQLLKEVIKQPMLFAPVLFFVLGLWLILSMSRNLIIIFVDCDMVCRLTSGGVWALVGFGIVLLIMGNVSLTIILKDSIERIEQKEIEN